VQLSRGQIKDFPHFIWRSHIIFEVGLTFPVPSEESSRSSKDLDSPVHSPRGINLLDQADQLRQPNKAIYRP
jgi:hypothetical protein